MHTANKKNQSSRPSHDTLIVIPIPPTALVLVLLRLQGELHLFEN